MANEPLRPRARQMGHVWLVSSIPISDDCSDEPEVVVATKAAAKRWVKDGFPDLVFSGDLGDGYFVARTPGSDPLARFSIQKVPYCTGMEATDG